mmetsp:Transcript_19504/g.27889  ORF Transcript_19504/g.27889 Transcript_19504/m.27889 type:complete len:203 (-) Transcript_19504:160-768(-)
MMWNTNFVLLFIVFLFGITQLNAVPSNLKPSSLVQPIQLNGRTGEMVTYYTELNIPTLKGIHLTDITPHIRTAIESCGVYDGQVNVLSKHTTTAITINEMEGRLVDDTRQFLLKLAPAAYPYLHNDLHLRNGPPNWPGGDEAWRAQEPINAHSHLLAMILGCSETLPIHNKNLMIGTWQSVIMVELDGPRTRNVAIQITGMK